MTLKTDALIEAFVAKLVANGVPVCAEDNSQLLDELEQHLPKRLPQSLEYLLSRYSFPSFDSAGVSLFGWSPNLRLNGFMEAASAPKGSLSEVLLPAGYLQIGRPDTGSFDAVCIDLNGNAQNRENRIVRADHEEILCNWRVKISGEVSLSFRAFLSTATAEGSAIYYEGNT